MTVPSTLSDAELVAAVECWAGAERAATASLIAHLAELEARRLHLAQGFRSLFGYCRHVLHCSEHEAYDRMEATHAARRFPVILALLAEGRLHLTAVRLLAPHLKDEDHLALLGGAIHKSKREILELLARWFPSEDAPTTLRRLPEPRGQVQNAAPAQAAPSAAPPSEPLAPPPAAPLAVPRVAVAAPRAAVVPLAPARYKLEVTLDGEAHDDLRALQDLLRRSIPTGDAAAIVARALKLLRQDTEKKMFSATESPRPVRPSDPASRDIPAHVQRAVWARDEGQCTFEGLRQRCPERTFLHFHHLTPWIAGGEASVVNIALRCQAHNQYEADVYFAPIRAARARHEESSFQNESAGMPAG